MGYTHHFESSDDRVPADIALELEELCRKTGTPLCLEYGSDLPPIFSSELICFNGVGEDGHDDFVLDFSSDSFSDFCKTNRKPYDLAVCICLLALSHKLPYFSFSSDGIWGDGEWDNQWDHAIDCLVEEGYPRKSLESFLR